jgi:serine phosphatase RsbU (regulator of sigma subunit)
MAGQNIQGIDQLNELIWQSRFSDSVQVHKKALAALKQCEKRKYQKGIASAKLNLAALHFYRSDNKNALKYLAESFRWLEKNKLEKVYVRALLIKGNIHESFGDYENTLKYWLEALKVAREINDLHSEGEACSQLGLIYSRLCNFKKSLEYFSLGLKIREELGDENAVASSLNRMGMVLRQMKRYGESLEYYFLSLEIRRRNNQASAIPWTQLGIANTYEEMGMYNESLNYYKKGLGEGDKRCRLQCLMGAGRVSGKLADSLNAEEWLQQSLQMAKELKSLVLISEAFSALSAHYEHFRKPDLALKNFKLYLKAKESFQSSEVQSRLSNIEITHAIERSEHEKEIYRLRHVELKKAYDIIEENNREITASINYASRIQRALLPSVKDIKGLEKSIFTLYLPKDIISGDFYWFAGYGDKLILVAADCTGHGVPGALMSMLGISFLEEIVSDRGIIESGRLLDELSREVRRALKQKGEREEAKDGMDICLCVCDFKAGNLQYSGAHNNLYLFRKGELNEYYADRMPIGYYDEPDRKFTTQPVEIRKGDMLYMFSDGFADQFGGPNQKKYKYSQLKEFLGKIHRKPLPEQKERLEKEFLRWKGGNAQTDDVLVLGYRV